MSHPLPSRTTLLFALLVASAAPALGQISVAPTALFLGDDSRFATFYVSNQSAAPQEVTVEFRFGYPASDSLGNVFMEYQDSTAEKRYSIGSYLRAFPRQFILPPGETQLVRLTARPAELPEGVYWTRLVTTSTPQAAFTDTVEAGVQARVVFRLQQITSVLYRKGHPNVDLAIENLRAAQDSTGITVSAWIDRNGTSPFLGSALVRIYDPAGTLVHESRESLAAYFSILRRFDLDTPPLAPGVYTAELTLSPDRTDIPPEHRLPMSPVSGSVRFSVE